jgi:hypothetical protein
MRDRFGDLGAGNPSVSKTAGRAGG